METVKLSVQPQIMELMAILEENGLHQQKDEVQSLVGYMEGMEDKLSEMMSEIKELRGDIGQLHDKTIQAKCAQLVYKVESKIGQTKDMVLTAKNNLIASAGNAVKTFREKGRAAFVQAMDAMHIPAALSHMKSGFAHAAQSMQQSAGQLDTIRAELHEVGAHTKNAGRVLLGKSAKPIEKLEDDKGVLAKLRGFLEFCGRSFSNMEQGVDRMAAKLGDKQAEVKKQSVKSKLKQLKTEHSEKTKAPADKELAR